MKPISYTNLFEIRVRFADVDPMGVAYYAHYLRWFEIGRTEFLRQLGITYKEVEKTGVSYPVTEVKVKYSVPIVYDELIKIRTWLGFIKKASLKMEYEIVNADTDEFHAEGYTIHAAVESGGKIVRISDRLLSFLAE
jgi:acyl-CoA thioester hydrolase